MKEYEKKSFKKKKKPNQIKKRKKIKIKNLQIT